MHDVSRRSGLVLVAPLAADSIGRPPIAGSLPLDPMPSDKRTVELQAEIEARSVSLLQLVHGSWILHIGLLPAWSSGRTGNGS